MEVSEGLRWSWDLTFKDTVLMLMKHEVGETVLILPKWEVKNNRQGQFTRLCFSSMHRESDCQARSHLSIGARRGALVSGTSISSKHLFRWGQAPGGSKKLSCKSSLFGKWAEALRSYLPQTFTIPSKELYAMYWLSCSCWFRGKMPTLLTVFMSCRFPSLSSILLTLSYSLSTAPFSEMISYSLACVLICSYFLYCQTCSQEPETLLFLLFKKGFLYRWCIHMVQKAQSYIEWVSWKISFSFAAVNPHYSYPHPIHT